MKDEDKTKEQLIDELMEIRQRVTELEESETERNGVGEALKKLEERYRALIETIEEGIAIVDGKDNFTFVNRAAADIFGYSKEELIGKNLKELTAPEEFQRFLDQTLLRKAGKPGQYALTVIKKDGEPRIIAVTDNPIIRDDGKYGGSFGIFHDITETKKAENRMAVVNEITRIVNSSLDIKEVYQAFLTQVAKLVAFDRSWIAIPDASGETFTPLACTFDAPIPQYKTENPLRGTGVEWTFEHLSSLYEPDLEKERRFSESQVLCEKGMRSYVVIPLIYKGRGIGAFCLSSRESNAYSKEDLAILEQIAGQITTAVRNAQLFEETRQRVEDLEGLYRVGVAITSALDLDKVLWQVYEQISSRMDLSTFHIALYDEEKHKLHFEICMQEKKSFEKHTRDFSEDSGLTEWIIRSKKPLLFRDLEKEHERLPVEAKIIGKPSRSLVSVPLLIHERAIGVMSAQSYEVNAFNEGHQRILATVGHQVAIAVEHARLFRDPRKKTEELGLKAEELERAYKELQQSHERLIQSERLKALGEMASGVAHDFNNLLGGILGWSQLMLMHPEDKKEVESGLKTIERMVLDGAEIVRRIQEFTRIRKDKTLGRVDVNEVVRGVVEMTRPKWKDQAQRSGVTIAVEMDLGKVKPVEGSDSELREILINMILNAVDAMPEGGIIHLKTETKEDSVYISISDTGIGMSKEIRQRIFEPFFSTKGPKKEGLGLSVAYGIVARHGGDISLNSVEGRGTTFTIRFPGSSEDMEIKKTKVSSIKAKPMRILVIDDDQVVRLMLTEMLKVIGHHVSTASGGRAGIEQFRKEAFDIVLTDLGMPGMSGWEVARAVREISPDTFVLLLTGWGVELSQKQLKESGVHAVMSKPLQMADLSRTIAEVANLKGER